MKRLIVAAVACSTLNGCFFFLIPIPRMTHEDRAKWCQAERDAGRTTDTYCKGYLK